MAEHDERAMNREEELMEQARHLWPLRRDGNARTCMRVGKELRRQAQAEHLLQPYLYANFEIMNAAQSTLEPEVAREAAMQNIALLESPERARRFQADYSEAAYDDTVAWMSACAYDNLAVATAMMHGYNSPGMQSVIGEGIHICHRTGKLKCIVCFREYATDVHLAADDLEMALHHARASAARINPDHERRWIGARNETRILLLQGRLSAAWDAGCRAMELAAVYHSPSTAVQETAVLMRTILRAGGRDQAIPVPAMPLAPRSPRDEHPEQDFHEDILAALEAVQGGQVDNAIEKLTWWDRWLTGQRCLHHWFETRLRLIAAHRLSGQPARADSLARQLEDKARQAFDYLTLRRLKLMMEDGKSPLPLAAPIEKAVPVAVPPSAPGAAGAAPASPPGVETGPLGPVIEELRQALAQAAGQQQPLDPIVGRILGIAPGEVIHENDAGYLLHLLSLIIRVVERDADVWAWTQALATRFPKAGIVLNLKAAIADTLRHRENSPLAANFSVDEIREWFRQSLELLPDGTGSFFRAAQFYAGIEEYGEAERCLARSCRLDRTNRIAALQLSNIYANTDRPSDALAVLDMCLREGGAEPGVLWEAGLLAVRLQRCESALSYFDAFAGLVPDQPWTEYYRALALLGLNRHADAAAAIEREAPHAADGHLHILAVRASAAAGLGDLAALRELIEEFLALPLREVGNLTASGIADNCGRVWSAATALPPEDPSRDRLANHLIATTMSPEALWEERRHRGQKAAGLSHYLCILRQPLDGRWADWPGRLPGQEAWPAYRIQYGVLAATEEEAAQKALEVHARCYPLPAEVLAVQQAGTGYTRAESFGVRLG